MISCSFTGHRDIAPERIEALNAILTRGVEYVYDLGVREFYTGGALGFDTMAAKAVIMFRMSHPDVHLHLLLPCRGQSDGWSQRQREVYDFIIGLADEVEYVSDEYYKGCMRARNLRLAECADVLIAYSGRSGSGSSQTIRFAKELGKEVFNLWGRVNNP
jgi:uncharacterized phage-like protein YoqJ